MAEWLRLVVEHLETWTQFPLDAESFCRAAAILRGTEPVSALIRALFILLRPLYFSSSWISSVAIFALTGPEGFNSEYEHPTSTVSEHLEQGQGL